MSLPRKAHVTIGGKTYEMQKRLGKGSFGEVYLGRDLAYPHETVAIKKFAFDKNKFEADLHEGLESYLKTTKEKIAKLSLNPSDANTVEREQLESRIQNIEKDKPAFIKSKLPKYYKDNEQKYQTSLQEMKSSVDHEHHMLNRVGEGMGPIASNHAEQSHFIAMKLAEGDSLTNILKMGTKTPNPLPPEELTHLTTQLIDKLLWLQENNIVLRDLHTNNIMVNRETGTVKLIDYGDALEMKAGQARAQAMGSPPFIAPEILTNMDAGKPANQYADYNEKTTVFTLGAIIAKMFELATFTNSKYVQFEGNPAQMFKTIKLKNENAPNTKIDDPNMRKELLTLLNQMTVEAPNNRTISLLEAKMKLTQVLAPYYRLDVAVTANDSTHLARNGSYERHTNAAINPPVAPEVENRFSPRATGNEAKTQPEMQREEIPINTRRPM